MAYSTKTQIYKVDSERPDPEIITLAAKMLIDGKLIAFPTETVYGLGANAFDSIAIDHIFEAKERPSSDPIIVHINQLKQVFDVAINIPDIAWEIADIFWPGPLTLILERNLKVPSNVSAGLNTVAIRMPSHITPQQLIKSSGVPIAAPSANLFTRPSPTTAEHVYSDLKNRVDIILDGGPCTIGIESTVVDLTEETPVLLRPGGTSLESLRQIIPNIKLLPKYLKLGNSATHSISPGMLSKHYSPKAKLLLFSGCRSDSIKKMIRFSYLLTSNGISVGVMIPQEDRAYFNEVPVAMKLLGSQGNLFQISHNLFAGMRELDKKRIDVILVRELGFEGLGLAIWDRLVRASDGLIINSSENKLLTLKIKNYVDTVIS